MRSSRKHLGKWRMKRIVVDKPLIALLNPGPEPELLTGAQFVELIRMNIGEGTQSAFAVKLGVSDASLSSVLSGKKRPGHGFLSRVGFERVVTFEKLSKGAA